MKCIICDVVGCTEHFQERITILETKVSELYRAIRRLRQDTSRDRKIEKVRP
jgi:hypothetical protein